MQGSNFYGLESKSSTIWFGMPNHLSLVEFLVATNLPTILVKLSWLKKTFCRQTNRSSSTGAGSSGEEHLITKWEVPVKEKYFFGLWHGLSFHIRLDIWWMQICLENKWALSTEERCQLPLSKRIILAIWTNRPHKTLTLLEKNKSHQQPNHSAEDPKT